MSVFETERLRLRPLAAQDFEPYAAMCADPEVMRYVGEFRPLSREDAWRQLALLAGHWQLRGYGMWAVEERASGEFAGRVGLHFPEGWPDREVAWVLARRFWGRGYALEAARAAVRVAFETHGWPRVASLIAGENTRSIRLAGRLGERFEREVELRGQRVGLYVLDRREWKPS